VVAARNVAAPSTRAAFAWAAPEASTGGLQAPSPPWLARSCRSRAHARSVVGGFSRTHALVGGKRRARGPSVVGLGTGGWIERGTPVAPITTGG